MTLPTIHLNGTSPECLRDGYYSARAAVRSAINALELVEFNARDYYPVPGSWDKAVAERRKHLEALHLLDDDLLAVMMHCQDAIDAREAQRSRL